MQRLAIPMGSRHSTRNSSRQLLVWGILAIMLTGWCAGYLLFTRDQVTAQVPENTTMVARFNVSRSGWEPLIQTLNGVTLVSNRPLSIQDLPSFVEGEFAILVSSTGHRTLSIRANEANVPEAFLESRGIVVQNTGKSIYLLSDRLEGTTAYSMPDASRLNSLYWPPKRLGTIAIEGIERAGTIRTLPNGNMEWRFPRKTRFSTTTLPPPPSGELIFTSTPAWTSATPPTLSAIEGFLSSIATGVELGSLVQHAEYAVARSEAKDLFLFKTQANSEHPEARVRLLKLASSVRTPKTRPFLLPDGKNVRELLIDSSSVTVESVGIVGAQADRVASGEEDGELLSLEKNRQWYFTNSRAWLESAISDTPPADGLCDGSLLGFQTSILSSAAGVPNTYWPYPITDLVNQYASVGLRQSLFSTILTFCR